MDRAITAEQLYYALSQFPTGTEICANQEYKLLVAGDNAYAAEFVDTCLQILQAGFCIPHVFWLTAAPERKANYLAKRPALTDFLEIDGKPADKKIYGKLSFLDLNKLYDLNYGEYPYAFLAMEDALLNRETAELIFHAASGHCMTVWVENETIKMMGNQKCRFFSSNQALETMAFLTHCAWEGEGNLDMEKARIRFDEAYNRNSSLGFVLSIPHKLSSIGIISDNPERAAQQMWQLIATAQQHPTGKEAQLLADMAATEHHRWLIEKACAGVQCLPEEEYASCIQNGTVKKAVDGRVFHPCLVPCTNKIALQSEFFQNSGNWLCAEQDRNLDPLDRVSVSLYRQMFQQAQSLRSNRQPLENLLNQLKQLSDPTNPHQTSQLDRYRFCIRNILDSSQPYTRQFETYEKSVLATFPQEKREVVSCLLKQIRKTMFPVLESNLRRDYKKYNYDMICRIPEILTGKREYHLLASLGEIDRSHNSGEFLFRSVASATALWADSVSYVLIPNRNMQAEILKSRLKGIRKFFDYRGMRCRISITAWLSERELANEQIHAITQVLKDAEQAMWINAFEIRRFFGDLRMQDDLRQWFAKPHNAYVDGSVGFADSHLLNGQLIQAAMGANPYFEFDAQNQKFLHCMNCPELRYKRVTSFLQVEDIFALMNAEDKMFHYPDFSDSYRDFWEIYCGNAIEEEDFSLCARAWTGLARIMQSGGSVNMTICNQPLPGGDELAVVKKMLFALARKRYILNLSFSAQDTVSFTIHSSIAKAMTAKSGDILETYVFFESCRTGWFDDVQTGYQFRWQYKNITNELDCVLTKGYRSILVECKSTKDISEDFYLTLDSLAQRYGIGCRKVLIAATDTAKKGYDFFVSRGNQMDIITISTKKDLEQIGEKLKEIMMR